MGQPRDLLKGQLFTANLALLVAVAASVVAVTAYRESHIPDLQGPALIRYLLSQRDGARVFVSPDEKNFVANPELYDPFPDSRGLLNVHPDFLVAVRRYESNCSPADLKRAEMVGSQLGLTPSKFLDWHRSVCSRNFANFHFWLDRAPYLHPSGVSYAKLFSQERPADPASRSESFLHVNERARLSDFDQWFLGLSPEDQKTFLAGFQIAPLGPELAVAGDWNGSKREIYVLPFSAVSQDLRETFSLAIAPARQSPYCTYQQFGICFSKLDDGQSGVRWKRQWSIALLLGAVVYAALAGVLSYWLWRRDGRRRNAEQALLFQVISHEMRTPMTVMKLSTDGLRQQFDNLDDRGQQSVLKILDGFSDLEKIVTRTLNEIKGENEARTFDLGQATGSILEMKFQELVRFDEPSQTVEVCFSDFWYEICLTNLVRNALLHGRAPIVVKVSKENGRAQVEVEDSGQASLKELRSYANPFFQRRSKLGLGLGLRIVAQKMKEAGGSLNVKASPTRFVLQFAPVEEK